MSAFLVVDLAAELHVDLLVDLPVDLLVDLLVDLRVDLLVDLRGALVDTLVLGVVKRGKLSSHRSFPVEASYQRSGYS